MVAAIPMLHVYQPFINFIYQISCGAILHYSVSAGFMLIGFSIYGAYKETNLAWSFAFTVAAGILTLVAGVLSGVQMKKSMVS